MRAMDRTRSRAARALAAALTVVALLTGAGVPRAEAGACQLCQKWKKLRAKCWPKKINGGGMVVCEFRFSQPALGLTTEALPPDREIVSYSCEELRATPDVPGAEKARVLKDACPAGAVAEAGRPNRALQRTPVEPQRTAAKPRRTGTKTVAEVVPLPRPDLLIRATRAATGHRHRLEAEVANVGPGDAGTSRLKLVYARSGHVLERAANVPALRAGSSLWVPLDLPGVVAPGIAITLHVDDRNAVRETDEGNNRYAVDASAHETPSPAGE